VRRALVATVGTVAGLGALLSYKSSGPLKPQKVSVAPARGPTPTTPATSASPATAPVTRRSYTGSLVQYFYGDIQVAVTVKGKKIVSVTVPQNGAVDGHSQAVNSYAVPILEQEALAAQGLNFNAVSGATFTSDAFAKSLQSALQEAGL